MNSKILLYYRPTLPVAWWGWRPAERACEECARHWCTPAARPSANSRASPGGRRRYSCCPRTRLCAHPLRWPVSTHKKSLFILHLSNTFFDTAQRCRNRQSLWYPVISNSNKSPQFKVSRSNHMHKNVLKQILASAIAWENLNSKKILGVKYWYWFMSRDLGGTKNLVAYRTAPGRGRGGNYLRAYCTW